MEAVTRPFFVRNLPGNSDPASYELSNLMNEWLTKNGPPGLFRCCGNCKSMAVNGPAVCTRFSMTPPIDIIMKGCDKHQDIGEIPF